MRKILFWLHLITGVVAGILIFVMSVTGVLLTFERQMTDWADRRNARVIPPPGAARIPLSELVAKSGGTPAGVIVRSDPGEPVELVMGRDRTIYVNPYTGGVTGHPANNVHAFFIATRAWHRWFATGKVAQERTEPIWDAANVLFFVLVLSGPFLWWPKKMTWRHLRPIVWFRGKLSGKARDFNWHNTIGLWMSIPLALIVLTGIILSYKWANDMVYHMTGNEPLKFDTCRADAEERGASGLAGTGRMGGARRIAHARLAHHHHSQFAGANRWGDRRIRNGRAAAGSGDVDARPSHRGGSEMGAIFRQQSGFEAEDPGAGGAYGRGWGNAGAGYCGAGVAGRGGAGVHGVRVVATQVRGVEAEEGESRGARSRPGCLGAVSHDLEAA